MSEDTNKVVPTGEITPDTTPAQDVVAAAQSALDAANDAVAATANEVAQATTVPDVRLTMNSGISTTDTAAMQQTASAVDKSLPSDQDVSPNFTPQEQQMINDFSKKIDVTDTNLVFAYGASAQQQIASFSDTALKNVQSKDLGEVGGMISGLVSELKGFSIGEDEGRHGLFGLFKRNVDKLELLRNKYDSAENNVNKIVDALQTHQVQLLKDIATLDQLYEQNLKYFKELSMYIEAGKKRIADVRATDLQAVRNKAQQSGLPEDAQAANDLAAKIDRFEKKIFDLELTRNISIQMAPQIRLLQNSNQMMAEKIQSSLVNTIPLWKSQMVMAMGIAHTQSAMEAQREVTNLTNDLLKRNADMLHQATIDTAKESERGIVDIETLKATNDKLIQTMDEVLDIQAQGKQKRAEAEQELVAIEQKLKAKMLEVRDAPRATATPPAPAKPAQPAAPVAPAAPAAPAPSDNTVSDGTITLTLDPDANKAPTDL